MDAAASQYQEALWRNQSNRVEVWIEKDALEGVVLPVCQKLRVAFFSCRGYVSQSEMWNAGRRLRRFANAGQRPVVIHLGDHDPSGIDMSRDIEDRLDMFTNYAVQVNRIALTMDQVEELNPPPNPTKLTDTRAEGYIEAYGHESWELDALDPTYLDRIIREAVEPFVDYDQWDLDLELERQHKAEMKQISDRWLDLAARWPDVQELLDS